MSSRALRKAQREREEQDQLVRLQQTNKDGVHDDSDSPAPSVKKSAFAMLGEPNEESEQIDDDDLEDDQEDDGGVTIPIKASVQTTMSKSSSSKKRKKKKKQKQMKSDEAKHEPAMADGDQDMDEIDRALKQLSANGHGAASGKTAAGTSNMADETSKLLAIDVNHLHAQNEMRRLFGRAALEQGNDDQPPPNANIGGNRRQQRRVQQVGLAQALRGQGAAGGRSGGLAAMALRRNVFIQGKEEWPIATGGGLGMEVEEKRADGTWLYTFVHNRIYRDVQVQFSMAVESMDPNRLVVLLQHNPYHISTLLQVSEIAKQERDHATSGDLLERSLFSFGRAVHSTFAKSLAEGKARLDFRKMENREFWLASWRYMQNLSMRATWRTVYEWAKLLLSLSPEDDPYALWLVLDQYAIRSRQDLDYLNISRNSAFQNVHQNMPNVHISQGLAEFRAGNPAKGRQTLYTAVGRFPWVIARLMQELNLDLPPGVWGKEPRTEKEKLYTEMYATRAKDLWNTPETSALLIEVTSALPPDMESSEENHSEIGMNEARHVLLSDVPALIALIPRRFTAMLLSSSDPLPPTESDSSYLLVMLQASRTAPRPLGTPAQNLTELQGLYGFFSNLFPWFRPAGANEDVDEAPPQFTEEEVEQRIRESGVDEEVIIENTRRMMELQNRLAGEFEGVQGGLVIDHQGEEREEENNQARVEDVPDSGD